MHKCYFVIYRFEFHLINLLSILNKKICFESKSLEKCFLLETKFFDKFLVVSPKNKTVWMLKNQLLFFHFNKLPCIELTMTKRGEDMNEWVSSLHANK